MSVPGPKCWVYKDNDRTVLSLRGERDIHTHTCYIYTYIHRKYVVCADYIQNSRGSLWTEYRSTQGSQEGLHEGFMLL